MIDQTWCLDISHEQSVVQEFNQLTIASKLCFLQGKVAGIIKHLHSHPNPSLHVQFSIQFIDVHRWKGLHSSSVSVCGLSVIDTMTAKITNEMIWLLALCRMKEQNFSHFKIYSHLPHLFCHWYSITSNHAFDSKRVYALHIDVNS